MSLRRLILPGIAVLALLSILLSQSNPLTRQARAYAQSVAISSAAVYVTLRSINAFLSAAQEVEVGGTLVVSGTVQPLKTLEPVDDTVERVASVVFAVMVVNGVLAVALGPVGIVGAGMVIAAVTLATVTARADVQRMARTLGWYGGFLAVAVPLAFWVSAVLADRMTNDVWARNAAIVAEIAAPLADTATEETTLQGRLWAALEDAEDYRVLAGTIYARADDLIGSYIAILAVFLFKILLLPALITGGFLVVIRSLARGP